MTHGTINISAENQVTTMKTRHSKLRNVSQILLLLLVAPCCFSKSAVASIIVNVNEVAGGVEFVGGGSVDLTGLSRTSTGSASGSIDPTYPAAIIGPTTLPATDHYSTPVPGPANFGFGSPRVANSGTGDIFGLTYEFNGNGRIILPRNYSSNERLEGSSFYSGHTLDSLGLTPGIYVFQFPNDSYTIEISSSNAVPEPTGSWIAIIGLLIASRTNSRSTSAS